MSTPYRATPSAVTVQIKLRVQRRWGWAALACVAFVGSIREATLALADSPKLVQRDGVFALHAGSQTISVADADANHDDVQQLRDHLLALLPVAQSLSVEASQHPPPGQGPP